MTAQGGQNRGLDRAVLLGVVRVWFWRGCRNHGVASSWAILRRSSWLAVRRKARILRPSLRGAGVRRRWRTPIRGLATPLGRVGLFMAYPVPNPAPQAPGALVNFGDMVIGTLKWFAIVGGVSGFIICAIMIIIGRRNRNNVAQDGLVGAVWVMGGLMLACSASALVGMFAL